MENVSILTKEQVEALQITQEMYDSVSLNRKSTFLNLYDNNGDFLVSVNSLDMKSGQDFLFLAELLRAAEINKISELITPNSLVEFNGILFRLPAIAETIVSTGIKRNVAKREDFKKTPQAPTTPVQQTAIQQAVF